MRTKQYSTFSSATAKFINEISKPLHQYGLTNFMHDITYGQGQITMLVNNKEIMRFYERNKIPMLCTDDSGRTLEEGVYLNKILETQFKDCFVLMPIMVKVAKQFGQQYGKNSVHIVSREAGYQHLYSLFFEQDEHDFLHWIINNSQLLHDFIENYNLIARDLILEAKSPENRIVLPDFNDATPSTVQTRHRVRIFHKTMHVPIYLSPQQGRCLKLLMQGKSTKEIAKILGLSTRTVEHYFERIRELLGCGTNKEMIAMYIDQFLKH
ncbi:MULTISPECIES: LuxR family transcriptional regulator [unclassified Legionella]|uniref:helix-turn-helix transcriptional regulator n=1 Tax=unclassified Legionella TaxID=2622702 RepID=UPI0010550BF5|nr:MULTISPECIES: LuxR family transcriptional regulator [unclassified Legionella]MDI9819795.1 LuxR C-terminal-related transcriptional regulator [Legionella sp. PL877]